MKRFLFSNGMDLGKGLNSLFKPGASGSVPSPHVIHEEPRLQHIRPSIMRPVKRESHHESIFHLEVDRIKPNPYQPRISFNEEELERLAASVKEFGILQPIIVSKLITETENGTRVEYQLVAGERRLMAAKRARLERIPAIVRKGGTSKTKLELALIENIQRSNLNPIEAARAYAKLQEEFGLTQKEIAERVGKSRESIANAMRLLTLSEDIQRALAEGKLSESHARHLLSLPFERRREYFERLTKEGMSARKIREKITSERIPDPARRYLERKLEEKFGVPASVSKNGARGKITMQFYSEEEYRELTKKLLEGEISE